MSDVMHLICLKDTGHILAAMAATTPGFEPALEDLVGDALPVANTRETVLAMRTSLVPLDVLELKSVPYRADVIGKPLAFVIDGGRVEELPPFAAAPAISAEVVPGAVLVAGGAVDRKVLAVVSQPDNPRAEWRVQNGKIEAEADGTAVDPQGITLSVMPGDTPAEITEGETYLIMTAYEGSRIVWNQDAA